MKQPDAAFEETNLADLPTAVSTSLKDNGRLSSGPIASSIRGLSNDLMEPSFVNPYEQPKVEEQRQRPKDELMEAFKHNHLLMTLGKGDILH